MTSRPDPRRRDRSWERADRDRDRDRYPRINRPHRDDPRRDEYRHKTRSRSRSPRRGGVDAVDRRARSRSPRRGGVDAADRRGGDRRDYNRRERAGEQQRSGDKEREGGRNRERERDSARPRNREKDREREGGGDRRDGRPGGHTSGDADKPVSTGDTRNPKPHSSSPPVQSASVRSPTRPAPADSKAVLSEAVEEGEEMDVEGEEDSAMAAMMGLSGFGSTKGKPVTGNQDGAADVKKMRTWRQYMNRRGGFNRPLDKIK